MSDFSLTTLYVLQNGDLAPVNFKRENLKPTQFGVFNSRYKAINAAGVSSTPYFQFGQGRIENLPGLTHKYSDKISTKSVIEFYKTTASPTPKNQITYVGYDGVDTSKTITAGCDEQFSVTIRARSLYIDTAFNYGLTRTITVTTPCCADCGDNCESVDPRIVAQLIAEGINKQPLLSKFFEATPVISCTVAPDAATVQNITIYHGVKTDDGDAFALAVVQNDFAAYDVKLVDHTDGVSTYEVYDLTANPAPVDGNGVVWTAFDTAVKVSRVLTLTLETTDAATTLTALQAFYAGDTSITVSTVSAGTETAEFKIVQYSTSIHPDANVADAKFNEVQDYNGLEWKVQAASLTGSGCVAGVKIEGKPLDKYGAPCDPIAFPYEFDKLTFEVFAYKGAPTSQDFLTYDRCDFTPVTTVQKSSYVTGSGEEIFMLEKRYNSEQSVGVGKHIYHNAIWNGGFVRYSDPNKFYDTYVLKFKSPDLKTWDSGSAVQDETVIIAVPTGEGGDVETFLTTVFGSDPVYNAGVL